MVLAGYAGGPVDLGGGPLTSGDGYVAKLDGSGAFLWRRAFPYAVQAASPDPCGAVIVAASCTSCAPSAPALTISKLAP